MFDPVAGITVRDVAKVIEARDMDMSANDAVTLAFLGMTDKTLFEFADELHGLLGPDFDACAETTIVQTKPSAQVD